MGKDSKIEWTHATFNPWRGCTKVSPGCTNCYAETLSHRNPAVLGEWGPNGRRVVAAESAWREPLKWDREAKAAGERRRVFCASLADVFEDREDLVQTRLRLWSLIEGTPNLDWLLLTKRPDSPALCEYWSRPWFYGVCHGLRERPWPPCNVWLGVSVEDQARADERIPALLQIPAAVRFLSVEPLLSAVDLTWLRQPSGDAIDGLYGWREGGTMKKVPGIDWVIVGGESGPHARPMHPDWARSIVGQCRAAGVPVFVKQLGANVVARNDGVADWFGECGHLDLSPTERFQGAVGRVRGFRDKKGGDPAEWPEDLRVRQFPEAHSSGRAL